MENKNNLSMMLHFLARFVGVIIAVALVLFAAVTALGIYWPDIQAYRYRLEAEKFQKEVEAEKLRIENLRKADTFGGKTPEETFDMFLDALKNNDADLAAKYYDVTVQDKALENYKKELSENGSLAMSLAYFSDVGKGEKKCNEKLDGCTFEYNYKTDKDEFVLDDRGGKILISKGERRKKILDLNNYSVWKIVQPL